MSEMPSMDSTEAITIDNDNKKSAYTIEQKAEDSSQTNLEQFMAENGLTFEPKADMPEMKIKPAHLEDVNDEILQKIETENAAANVSHKTPEAEGYASSE